MAVIMASIGDRFRGNLFEAYLQSYLKLKRNQNMVLMVENGEMKQLSGRRRE